MHLKVTWALVFLAMLGAGLSGNRALAENEVNFDEAKVCFDLGRKINSYGDVFHRAEVTAEKLVEESGEPLASLVGSPIQLSDIGSQNSTTLLAVVGDDIFNDFVFITEELYLFLPAEVIVESFCTVNLSECSLARNSKDLRSVLGNFLQTRRAAVITVGYALLGKRNVLSLLDGYSAAEISQMSTDADEDFYRFSHSLIDVCRSSYRVE